VQEQGRSHCFVPHPTPYDYETSVVALAFLHTLPHIRYVVIMRASAGRPSFSISDDCPPKAVRFPYTSGANARASSRPHGSCLMISVSILQFLLCHGFSKGRLTGLHRSAWPCNGIEIMRMEDWSSWLRLAPARGGASYSSSSFDRQNQISRPPTFQRRAILSCALLRRRHPAGFNLVGEYRRGQSRRQGPLG